MIFNIVISNIIQPHTYFFKNFKKIKFYIKSYKFYKNALLYKKKSYCTKYYY